MKNATTMNENEIRNILCEYLGKRKAVKIAQIIYREMEEEVHHTQTGKEFFVREDENGGLIFTHRSMVGESVKRILEKNLETHEDVDECFASLMKEKILTETHQVRGFETIHVEGANRHIYKELFESRGIDSLIDEFLDNLSEALSKGVRNFEVPVYDMSIGDGGKPFFIPGRCPATNLSFKKLKQLAEDNDFTLGTKAQYVLFLATMIERMKRDDWRQEEAMKAVCCNSTELGHYYNTEYAQNTLQMTGSRGIAGKYDLANVKKILATDERYSKVCTTSGDFAEYGYNCPLAKMTISDSVNFNHPYAVGWFVF